MLYLIYGEDAAKIREAIKGLPKNSKRICHKSSHFDGRLTDCDKVIVTCGSEEIIAAYGDKVQSKPEPKVRSKKKISKKSSGGES